MGPSGVVGIGPRSNGDVSSGRVWVWSGIGPVPERSLDEALDLAIGAWGVGRGADVPDAGLLESAGEQPRAIGRAVVGHHPLAPHPETREPVQGPGQEGRGILAAQAGQDFGLGQATGIIDGDVQMVPADASAFALAGAIAADPVSDALEAPQASDIEMEQFAGAADRVAQVFEDSRQVEDPRHAVDAFAQSRACAAEVEPQELAKIGAEIRAWTESQLRLL